ncbi:protein kinase [Gigaspora margarita]|uniref:Protein kinase n=1 Tax=Gigaspora margarita TaxID=4874 RepID=A0A8H4A3N3_GIGMA|nr:protein kinase [Gigaspora margarita]
MDSDSQKRPTADQVCSELNYWYRIVRQSELRLSEEKYNIRNYFLKADKQVNELPTQQSKIQESILIDTREIKSQIQESILIDTREIKSLFQQRSKYLDYDTRRSENVLVSDLIKLSIPDIEIKMNSEENRDIEIEKESKGSFDVKIEKKSEKILDFESENKTEEITGNKNYEPVEEESAISIESSGNYISENRVDEVDEKKMRNHFNNTAYLLKQSVYKTREEQYEFFKTQFSNDKELNILEKQYLLNALQRKFDKLKVKNNEGEMRQCKDCNNSVYAIEFCEFCIRKYLQRNFCKWTGNNEIDEAIQEAQLKTIAPDLAIICGFRPEIVCGTPFEYEKVMKKCWDAVPENRPDAKEIYHAMNDLEKSFSVTNMFGNDLYWSIPKSFSSGGKSWMLSLPELPAPRNFEKVSERKLEYKIIILENLKIAKEFEVNEKLFEDSKINYFEPDRLYESTDAVTSHEEFRIYDIDETRQNAPNQYIITENFKCARSSIINNENGILRIAEILYLIFDELHNEGFSEEDINEEIKRYIATIDKKLHDIFTWLCENQFALILVCEYKEKHTAC